MKNEKERGERERGKREEEKKRRKEEGPYYSINSVHPI
jgi:hypothetical protein